MNDVHQRRKVADLEQPLQVVHVVVLEELDGAARQRQPVLKAPVAPLVAGGEKRTSEGSPMLNSKGRQQAKLRTTETK